MRQIPLPLDAPPSHTAADFVHDASNAAARSFLHNPAGWSDGRLAVFGPAGAGKTHLAHVAAARFGWSVQSACHLRGLAELPPRGWVLDDADLAPEPVALFHALNAAREAGLPLLLLGRTPPARWDEALPDLQSRLRATLAVEIKAPGDALLAALLAKHLADRQLAVPPALQTLMLTHLPRDAASIAAAARRLDEAALDAGRLNRSIILAVLHDTSVAEAAISLPQDQALL